MELEERLRLSYYREIAPISPSHGVKLVQHTETGKVCVLKCLRVYDRRVYDLIRSACPAGVPHIYDLIETDGILYAAEEYISGKSLRELLDEKGVFSEAEAVGVIDQICDILQFLHRQTPPIVHRDIKPENILMDERGQLFLVDFNAAKECDGDKPRDTVLFGTAGYAAPEQYGFGASTPAADIYALGVLLRVLLTGNDEGKLPPNTKIGTVIEKCTRLDPADRYAAVGDVQNALHGWKKESPLRKWLPPGLRSNDPKVAVPSALWYGFILLMSAVLEIKDATPFVLWWNRLCCFVLLLSETLWLGNYRGVWRFLPLSGSKNRGLRILGVALWASVLFCGIMLVCTAVP